MRKAWLFSLALALALTAGGPAEARELVLSVGTSGTSECTELTYEFDEAWFAADPYEYNHALARLCCALSSTVYLEPQGKLTALLEELGADAASIRDYHYAPEDDFKDKTGYTFAALPLPEGTLVLAVVRGTNGRQEWLSNLNIADTARAKGRYHEGFYNSSRELLTNLASYMEEQGIEQSTARVLFTGHSRGAAVAGLSAALLEEGFPSERVYAYTFATPNTMTDIAERRAARYQNIFNVLSPEDVVPELPFRGGSWDYGSVGKNLYLPSAYALRGDRLRYDRLLARMSVPFAEITGRRFTPMPGSEETARTLKNLQWFVGSVSRFYRSGGRLGYANVRHLVEEEVPVFDDDSVEEVPTGLAARVYKHRPEVVRGALDMHSPDTYNSWLLAGEPEELFLRGTPTRVRVFIEELEGQPTKAALLKGSYGAELTLSLPGGEEVARVEAGEAVKAPRAVDAELRALGHRSADFIVPEGERLALQITAPKDLTLRLETYLEANSENGLNKEASPLATRRLTLKKGDSRELTIENRRIKN